MRRPNFFIIGAPKCGTTSLARAIAKHPQIYMPKDVEPNHFCRDLREDYKLSDQDYLRRYYHFAKQQHLLLGEKSTWYLASKVACESILQFQPSARFIAVIRNPKEAAPSLHSELLKSHDEDVKDFRRAWELQEERARGLHIPRKMKVPKKFLQYKDICSFGTQILRVMQTVPQDQFLVLFLEDFITDGPAQFKKIFDFLGVEGLILDELSHENERRAVRSHMLEWLLTPPEWIVEAAFGAKIWLNIEQFFVGDALIRLRRSVNSVRETDKDISPEMAGILARSFESEIALVERLTGRNLPHWRA